MSNLPQKTGAGSLLDDNTTVSQQKTNMGNLLQTLIDLIGQSSDTASNVNSAIDTMLGRTASVSAAATIDLSSMPMARTITITNTSGATAISSFGPVVAGAERMLVFSITGGSVSLTHNATSLQVPGNQSLTVQDGDVARLLSLGSGNWKVLSVSRHAPEVGLQGMRNRIINGDMRIDQRNTGTAVTPALTTMQTQYTLDRWFLQTTQASKLTVQQNAGAVSPPDGFTNYLGITVASAFTPGSTDGFNLVQHIEGYNTSDLGWGSASAQSVTLSFWVRSSLTGTFGGAVYNASGNRSYPFTYTINSSNTWEKKSITIPGDTAGTWLIDNGIGASIEFSMGAGTNYQGTANAWNNSWKPAPAGAGSLVANAGATWYITGVQFEPGSYATPFERRNYCHELMLCQRYYEKSYQMATKPGTPTSAGMITVKPNSGSNLVFDGIPFKVSKRAAPSVTLYSTISGAAGMAYNNGEKGVSVAAPSEQSFVGVNPTSTNFDTIFGVMFHFTASAEL